MRVYGALMWSLGKVIHTPEVARVYIGSFWDQPFLHAENRGLFEAEAGDLIGDLQTLPDNAALRKALLVFETFFVFYLFFQVKSSLCIPG